MDYRGEVKKLLLQLLREEFTHEQVTRIFHITAQIAEVYLKHYYSSFLNICSQYGMTKKDLAEDAVIEVFGRDREGNFFQLVNFVESLDGSLEQLEAEEVFRAYRAFVQQVAIRQLIKTYGNLDSTASKIYRNIYDAIQKTNTAVLKKDYRGAVLDFSTNKTSSEHLPTFPIKLLEQRFAIKMKASTTIPDMLAILKSVVTEQDQYRNSLPMFEVVKLFKRYYFHISTFEPRQANSIDLKGVADFDQKIIKDLTIKLIGTKIFKTYVVSEKIDVREGDLLYRTLVNIINEWFDETAEKNTYYEHVKMKFDISEEEYEERWRTKIEYLTRTAREKIVMFLIEGIVK